MSIFSVSCIASALPPQVQRESGAKNIQII